MIKDPVDSPMKHPDVKNPVKIAEFRNMPSRMKVGDVKLSSGVNL
jgi:hypothetical protein